MDEEDTASMTAAAPELTSKKSKRHRTNWRIHLSEQGSGGGHRGQQDNKTLFPRGFLSSVLQPRLINCASENNSKENKNLASLQRTASLSPLFAASPPAGTDACLAAVESALSLLRDRHGCCRDVRSVLTGCGSGRTGCNP